MDLSIMSHLSRSSLFTNASFPSDSRSNHCSHGVVRTVPVKPLGGTFVPVGMHLHNMNSVMRSV